MTGDALILIGFMGTGKSAAGRAIAAKLQVPRFDTDEMVAAKLGMSVAAIFRELGEAYFRDAETDALAAIPDGCGVVVTGGGAVLREQNRAHCRRLGMVAWLTADEQTIFERISRRPLRPLLQSPDPHAKISELLCERQSIYRALAHFQLDTSALSHAEVVEALLERWPRSSLNAGS